MIRAIGVHNNTKIQLVASGEGNGTFIGNGTSAGSALLMWASEPQQTYSGSGIGNNFNASPGSTAETRQFTEQAQTFIRFTDNGRIGFHTSAVGATASLTPKVAILSTGGLDVQSEIASTSSTSGALVVTGAGGAGIGGALNVGATATFGGNVGIGTNAPVNKLEVVSNTSGYTGGIIGRNAQSTSAFSIIPLGTNAGVGGWTNSSVVFEGVPAASGNTIIGSYYNDLVFQTGGRANRMRINLGGALIHNGTTSGAVGAISFVPSSENPIYNRIVFGGDNTGYGLAIASQHMTTNAVTDRLVIYDNGRINIPVASASTSTTTGALTVVGGLGVAGALYAGGGISAGGITLGSARLDVPSGTAPIFGARAWGVATWSGSAISLTNSGNIASVVYDGNRQFTFTFNSNMPTTNYVVVATPQRLQVTSGNVESAVCTISTRTASTFTIGVESRNGDQIIDTAADRLQSIQVVVFC
jgi:hypothetical protein